MTDTNEEKRPLVPLKPLPDIEGMQPLVIADELDTLLAAVKVKAGVTKAQYEQEIGRFERSDDPIRFLFRKKRFLLELLRKGKWKDLPQAYFTALVRLAVYEPDPSFNRYFLEPALWAFGYRRVQEALLEYLEVGTNREKAGAARACYWAWFPIIYDPRTEGKDFQRIWEELADVRLRRDILLLKTFVECEDLDVQRSIIPILSLAPSSYPAEWQRLIPQAIHLARTHPDDYIRHRIEIQMGA
jgi:hypothetical protein